jgi:hypothetical protein
MQLQVGLTSWEKTLKCGFTVYVILLYPVKPKNQVMNLLLLFVLLFR